MFHVELLGGATNTPQKERRGTTIWNDSSSGNKDIHVKQQVLQWISHMTQLPINFLSPTKIGDVEISTIFNPGINPLQPLG